MQTIQFTIDDQYSPTILTLLKSLKEGIINDLSIKSDTKESLTLQDKDIFSKTSGILESHNIDPLEWQNRIRSEWER